MVNVVNILSRNNPCGFFDKGAKFCFRFIVEIFFGANGFKDTLLVIESKREFFFEGADRIDREIVELTLGSCEDETNLLLEGYRRINILFQDFDHALAALELRARLVVEIRRKL